MASDKLYTKKTNLYFIGTKYGTYPQSDLVKSRQELSKRGKNLIKHCFFKMNKIRTD